MLITPFFMKNKDWWEDTENKIVLSREARNNPDLVRDFKLFNQVLESNVYSSEEDRIEKEKKMQEFEEFEDYLENKYRDILHS
nr:MAG TPA: hypothetical protein [Caudoviricetes sp.]